MIIKLHHPSTEFTPSSHPQKDLSPVLNKCELHDRGMDEGTGMVHIKFTCTGTFDGPSNETA